MNINIKQKILEWIKRYGIAEIIGLFLGLLSANFTLFVTGNKIIAAFIGTWSENIGFYSTIAYSEYKLQTSKHKNHFKQLWIVFRNIIIEFGPSEYLDSFLIRPFYLSVFPYFIDNYSFAIFLGSIAANITYYIPTIIAYEVKKKMIKE